MIYLTNKQEKILNLVNKLGCIHEEQVKKLTKYQDPNKILNSILNVRNPMLKKIDNCYCSIFSKKIDKEIIDCIHILTTLENIEWFSLTDFPYKLTFIREGKIFDILYMEKGNEFMQYQLIERSNSDRIIILLDEKEKYKLKEINKRVKYCTIKNNKAIFGDFQNNKLLFKS